MDELAVPMPMGLPLLVNACQSEHDASADEAVNQAARVCDVHRRVLELYQDVDRAVAKAGPVCLASGRCCRFKEYGHVLFVSNLEAEVLLAAAPEYQGPVSHEFCPFQQDNLCTAREPRPLGCRIYYCDPTYQETGNALTEEYLGKLKHLAEEHSLPWRYAPLHQFLNEHHERKRSHLE